MLQQSQEFNPERLAQRPEFNPRRVLHNYKISAECLHNLASFQAKTSAALFAGAVVDEQYVK